MPHDPLLPDSTGPARPSSPDAAGGSDRKRRRKVLSCYDCRRRKLQCDRAMPACGRCTKAGQAANCLYIDDATDTPMRNADLGAQSSSDFPKATPDTSLITRPGQGMGHSGDLLSRLEYQDRRIKELEAALAQGTPSQVQLLRSQKLPLTPESFTAVENASVAVNATDRETMLLRGKSFKTQFHGISFPGSLIAYIPELAAFTKETFETYPGLARIRQDLHALEDRTDYAGQKHRPTSEEELRALLPGKVEADELIRLYMDNYEPIYHIFHLPTFWQEYDEMWSDIHSARAHFVAIVLLMMAIAQCIRNIEPWLYTANSSTARERALGVVQPCEDWLMTQSQKHVTIADFQIRFLLNLAKLVNGSKFKRTWTDAGTLLRFCMSAGLHRNPDLLRKPTSAMDKEMRRRIWFAVAEFELQAAFSRGMMSAPWPHQSDYVAPSNIHDEDFDQDTQCLPSSKAFREFTNTSYMTMANETFMLRYSLNNLVNHVRQTITFEDVKRYTEEIEAYLQSMPHWIGSSAEVPQTLLCTTLRQYMLVLHDRQIRHGASPSEQNFSKMVIVDNAKKILDVQRSLVERGSRVLQFLCHDQIRAALSVCHVVSMADPQVDSVLNQIVENNAFSAMNDAIELVSDKINRLGREQRQLWMILAANAFMRTKKEPSRKPEFMQEAVDKITRPYYKIMACQEDAPSAVSSGPPTGRADLPSGIIEYLPNVEQQKPGEFGPGEPTLLDFDAIAAWTFDDWTLNPGDFPAFVDPYQP